MTRQQLAAVLLTVAPRTAQMVEALVLAEAELQQFDVGMIELHYAPGQVKSVLKVSLGCYKVDKQIKRT